MASFRGINTSTNVDSSKHYTINTGSGSSTSAGSFKPTSTLTSTTDTAVNPAYVDQLGRKQMNVYLMNRLAQQHGLEIATHWEDMNASISVDVDDASERGFGITPARIGEISGKLQPTLGLLTSIKKNMDLTMQHLDDASSVGSSAQIAGEAIAMAGKFKNLWSSIWGQGKQAANYAAHTTTPAQQTTKAASNMRVYPSRARGIETALAKKALKKLQSIMSGSESPLTKVMPALDGSNEMVPESITDAILCGKRNISVADTVDLLEDLYKIGSAAEQADVTSQAVLIGMTCSTPNITITPSNSTMSAISEEMTQDDKAITVEAVSIAGGDFDLNITATSPFGSETIDGGIDPNTLQIVANTTPTAVAGMDMQTLAGNKEEYTNCFEDNGHEVLLASPSQVAAADVTALTWQNVSVLEGCIADANDTVTWLQAFGSSAPHIDAITGVWTKGKQPIAKDVDTGNDVYVHLALLDNFSLSQVYDEYIGHFNIKLSYITNGVATEGFIQPGIVVASKATGDLVFIRATQEGDSSRMWTVGFSSDTVRRDMMFGAQGLFTVVVAGGLAALDNITHSVKMMPSTIALTRQITDDVVGTWIYDRTPTDAPLISKIFTVTPMYRPSDSARDVVNVWSAYSRRYYGWMTTVIRLLDGEDSGPMVAAISARLRDSIDDTLAGDIRNVDEDLLHAALHKGQITPESTRHWLKAALSTINNWMYYSGTSPWAIIRPDKIPLLATNVLSIANGLCKVAVYQRIAASTKTSAQVNLPAILDGRIDFKRDPDVRANVERAVALRTASMSRTTGGLNMSILRANAGRKHKKDARSVE